MVEGATGNVLEVTRTVQTYMCVIVEKCPLSAKKYSNRTVLVVATTLCTY